MAEDQRRWQAHVAELIERTVPPEYRDADLGNHPAVEQVRLLWPSADARHLLYVYGTAGNGKTRLAWATWMAWLREGLPEPVYHVLPDLLDDLSAAKFSSLERFTAAIHTLETTTALVILDDIGQEVATETVVANLYRIVNARQSWNRPLMVVGNLTPAELGTRYDRIASRLSSGELIPLVGRDRRIRKS